jgi:CRP/FNR family transcriptional regulator, nitrogen fixation regulation protein
MESQMLTLRTASQVPNSPRHAANTFKSSTLGLSVAQMGAPVPYARDTEIYGEGEPIEYIYQVVSGAVRTYTILSDGRRQIGAFYLPGDMFGLEVGEEHDLSAEAVCDCTIAVIKRSSLTNLAQRDGSITQALWTLTARELQRAQKHMLLLVRSAQERVASFLLEMADRNACASSVVLPMPRRDIADYLGLTIETVSRALTALEGQSAIALNGARRVQLTNLRELRRLDS